MRPPEVRRPNWDVTSITDVPVALQHEDELGLACMYLGQPAAGIPHIEKAIRLSPHDPRAARQYGLARCHLLLGQLDKAIDASVGLLSGGPSSHRKVSSGAENEPARAQRPPARAGSFRAPFGTYIGRHRFTELSSKAALSNVGPWTHTWSGVLAARPRVCNPRALHLHLAQKSPAVWPRGREAVGGLALGLVQPTRAM
jgi:hypothetical protein